MYIRDGAQRVTFIGKTDTDGTKLSIVPAKEKLEGNESVPKLFSDLPCEAQYVPYYNDGSTVYLTPNGAGDEKYLSDTSLLENGNDKFYKMVFKPGHTVTWANDDGSVLEEDKGMYYDGMVPEYNGDTPTKEKDAQYTYTFKGWDKEITGISADTTYTATYSTTIN